MKKSAIVDGNMYVISLWPIKGTAWQAANSRGLSWSVGYLCSLVLVQMDTKSIYTPLQLTEWVDLSHMRNPMGFMIKGGMIFCDVVGKIVRSRNPKEQELTLSFASAEPVVLHLHIFVLRWIMVLLDTPTAVELSHWMGDLGCSQTISMRVCQNGTMTLTQMNRPAILGSEVDDIKNLMIWAIVRTGT